MDFDFGFLKWIFLGAALGRLFPARRPEPQASAVKLRPTPLVPSAEDAIAALEVVQARLVGTGSTPEEIALHGDPLVSLLNRDEV